MPRTARQYENIREERKALIMRTALELFASKGYYGTTISSIAGKAGISKGLLYNYFESKEELIKTIIFSGLENIERLLDPDGDGIISYKEMESLLDRFFALLEEDLLYWRLYFSLFVQSPVIALVEDRLTEVIQNYTGMLQGYFESRGCDDPHSEALLFGALLDGIGFNYISNPGLFPVEKIKKVILKKYS
ncbi:MAG: TetR/AcrR family transcriptional regulator [Bacteroidales bacterium]|nr:TetR/AcrR family transcriptional regulator [Bacteroidales bacterium]